MSTATQIKIYYEKDASLDYLKGKTIGVIGYGSQGHAQALNLKDSGLNVTIGLRADSSSVKKAKEAGFKVAEPSEIAKNADVIQLLAPDEMMADLYATEIAPYLKAGKVLMFSHGLNIHFKLITPPKDVDVIMIAPKAPGYMVRRTFTEGGGVPALIAVQQNASGKAKEIGLAYAMGIGSARAGVLETTFKEETETDLFGEQNVLCGGTTALVRAGFETLVEAGYQPEVAYFECLHELKLIVDLMYEGGIANMHQSISNTAEFGDHTVGPKIITPAVKAVMKDNLKRIQNGEFTKEFVDDYKNGFKRMKEYRKAVESHPIEVVGERLRGMMSWLKGKKIV